MRLSDKERMAVEMLRDEKTYKEIAAELHTTEGCVRTALRKLRKRTGAKNSVGLVYRLVKLGLVA